MPDSEIGEDYLGQGSSVSGGELDEVDDTATQACEAPAPPDYSWLPGCIRGHIAGAQQCANAVEACATGLYRDYASLSYNYQTLQNTQADYIKKSEAIIKREKGKATTATTKVASANQKAASAESKLARAEKGNRDLQSDLDEAVDESDFKQAKLSAAEARCRKLEGELAAVKAKCHTLQGALDGAVKASQSAAVQQGVMKRELDVEDGCSRGAKRVKGE